MKAKMRAASITGMASIMLLALAPQALANWTSSITRGGTGFESRRWDDELYSQIKFTNCTLHYLDADAKNATDVAIWHDISLLPDDKYDTKTFTACFDGGTSNGEWTDLGEGMKSVYFRIQSVGGSTTAGSTIDASSVSVDTTKAD
ncbi:hypothetical protein ACFC09_11275 [Streptomyces sp. NPDC056161]|uniref:hypothetical protein n=1 Tax=Streptomyces sp. NPDC056161 TaxID=3345732 RepID=UPI0035E027BA